MSKALAHLSAKEDGERLLEAALKAKAFAEDTALATHADAEAVRGTAAAAVAKATAVAEADATVAMASAKRSMDGQLRAMEARIEELQRSHGRKVAGLRDEAEERGLEVGALNRRLQQRELEAEETERRHERELREAADAATSLREAESSMAERTRSREEELAVVRHSEARYEEKAEERCVWRVLRGWDGWRSSEGADTVPCHAMPYRAAPRHSAPSLPRRRSHRPTRVLPLARPTHHPTDTQHAHTHMPALRPWWRVSVRIVSSRRKTMSCGDGGRRCARPTGERRSGLSCTNRRPNGQCNGTGHRGREEREGGREEKGQGQGRGEVARQWAGQVQARRRR